MRRVTESETIALAEIRRQPTGIARDRWQKLSLSEPFGNVGSEISRAIRCSNRNPTTAQALFDHFAPAARRARLSV